MQFARDAVRSLLIFIFYLSLPSRVRAKSFADIFNRKRMFDANSKIKFDDISLSIGQCTNISFDFIFSDSRYSGHHRGGRTYIFPKPSRRIVFLFIDKRGNHRNMAGSHAEGVVLLFARYVKDRCKVLQVKARSNRCSSSETHDWFCQERSYLV